MFENQTAPAKSGKTIWGLRRLFFTGIMQHVWSCPPISGDHQYVSAQVRPVEAFHIGCCSLTQYSQLSFGFSKSASFFSIAAMSSQLLDSGFAKDKYDNWLSELKLWNGFSRRHGNVNRRGSSMMEMEGFTGKEPTTMDRDSDSYRWSLTTGQVYNIFNVFDGQLKQSQSLFYVNSCPPLFILCPWQWWW